MNRVRPKVATVTSAHRPDDIRVVWKECRALSSEYDLTLIAPEGPLPLAKVDFEYTAISVRHSRWARFLFNPIECFRELRRGRFDLVHAHDPELLPLLLLWKILHPSSVVVYDAHESLGEQIAGKSYIPHSLRPLVAFLASALLVLVVRRIDGVVAATPKIAQSIRGAKSGRVIVVQNFPWLSDYPEPVELVENVAPNLCYVGAISEARGRGAMEALADSLPGVNVVVAGKDLPQDRSDGFGAPANVHYVGSISSDSVPSFIAQHSVGLALLSPLPNYLWSQPTKIFEYMASARPFIASDLPRWRELFGDLEAGLLVDPSDPEEVALAARTLLHTPGLARQYGLRGRRAVVENFSFEIEAERLVGFYQDLIGGHER